MARGKVQESTLGDPERDQRKCTQQERRDQKLKRNGGQRTGTNSWAEEERQRVLTSEEEQS